jgi:hypothetical protein
MNPGLDRKSVDAILDTAFGVGNSCVSNAKAAIRTFRDRTFLIALLAREFRIMRMTIFSSIAGAVALAAASAASAQVMGGSGAAPSAPTGGVRSQDVAAANRQIDSDYNTLAARGVKVTNQDRVNARSKHASAVPATEADIKAGAQVRDVKGVPVGTIATLAANEVAADPTQAVIDTGQTKIGVPLSAFGKDDKGLMLSITAEKFNQLVAQVHAKTRVPEPGTN